MQNHRRILSERSKRSCNNICSGTFESLHNKLSTHGAVDSQHILHIASRQVFVATIAPTTNKTVVEI